VPRESDIDIQSSDFSDGTIVRTPIQRAAVFTTVHCALLTELGLGSHIVAVADAKYVKVPYVQQQLKAGRIVDCGNGLNPVVEKIMDVKPDAILLSPFENSGGYGKTEEIGIPIIECAEYMETSPLARAEWMRFYGLLFGVSEKADRLFHQVNSCYTAYKQQCEKIGPGRSVIMDKIAGTVWYMPGGKSTIGQMLKDAGASYPWADDEQSGSLSLPFEAVLERAGEADVWMLRYSSDHELTYDELLSDYHGYSQLRAFRNREVYGCNVELSSFYEDTPFHPERLLSDFMQILHPDIIGMSSLRYYKKIKE
jgi:iron complex transport system substrate-binding protein